MKLRIICDDCNEMKYDIEVESASDAVCPKCGSSKVWINEVLK